MAAGDFDKSIHMLPGLMSIKCRKNLTCSVSTVPTGLLGLVRAISFVSAVTTRSRASRSGLQPRAASNGKASTLAPAFRAQPHTWQHGKVHTTQKGSCTAHTAEGKQLNFNSTPNCLRSIASSSQSREHAHKMAFALCWCVSDSVLQNIDEKPIW